MSGQLKPDIHVLVLSYFHQNLECTVSEYVRRFLNPRIYYFTMSDKNSDIFQIVLICVFLLQKHQECQEQLLLWPSCRQICS